MGFWDRKNSGGLLDVIRCDEESYLIWKWHPKRANPGDNDRENAIRFGSSLRVRDGEVAVFVHATLDGIAQDYIEGPFDGLIETQNLPILSNVLGLVYGGDTPFQAEVYFINLSYLLQTKFAVPFFDVYDPRFPDFGVPVAVRGVFSYRISNYQEFIRLHKLVSFSPQTFYDQVKSAITRQVKGIVASAPQQFGIPVVQLESRILEINTAVEDSIKERMPREFGVTVSSLDISAIDIDKTSEGYRQLLFITRDMTAKVVQAQTEANVQAIIDNQRMQTAKAQAELNADYYAKQKETQSANLAAYQIEANEKVGVAGAQGLGQASAGLGGIGGMNPAGMMAGIAVGGALGQNVAGAINNMMASVPTYPNQTQNVVAPLPIPMVLYYVAVNGQATGPYEAERIRQMIRNGQIKADSLVWKQGMANWVPALSVEELCD